jgi:hypothetical protein
MSYKKVPSFACRHEGCDGNSCSLYKGVVRKIQPSADETIRTLASSVQRMNARWRLDRMADQLDQMWGKIPLVEAADRAVRLAGEPLDMACLEFIRRGRPVDELSFVTKSYEKPRKTG